MKELMKKSHERENREMNDKIAVCLGKGGQRDMAEAFCRRTGAQLQDKPGDFLTVRFDSRGVSLSGFGLTYQGILWRRCFTELPEADFSMRCW